MIPSPPLRLAIDADALVANWRLLDRLSGGAACGAAVKADGYGLGAREVAGRLAAAGCRDVFVTTWAEAEALSGLGLDVAVLHGARAEDMDHALSAPARPVLSTPEQVVRWRAAGGGRCDVMIETGMNRLGLDPGDVDLLDDLPIDTLHSHLACADEPDHALNARQRDAFAAVPAKARRRSLANSAGIFLGGSYHFDLVRPGVALYGGVPGPAAHGIVPVARIEAQVLQVRRVPAGAGVGYGATWTAPADTDVAILNLGYADGVPRALSNVGAAFAGDVRCPFAGRVSMDLIAVAAPDGLVGEGDWLTMPLDLPALAAASGRSQYELLTGLGRRYGRRWS